MSNLWFNIRFGLYHFQCGPDKFFSITKNQYQELLKETDTNWKWFEIYELFGISL